MTPINETCLEKSTYDLFQAWLSSFFDGGAHAVGGNAGVVFPRAALGFAQSSLVQPMNPIAAAPGTSPAPALVGITMVLAGGPHKVQRRWDTVEGQRQQVYYKPVHWNFWVRCATAGDEARSECMLAASRLEALLANAATTRVLAQNGVHRIRPGTVEVVADTTYILRLLPCAATLRYAVVTH